MWFIRFRYESNTKKKEEKNVISLNQNDSRRPSDFAKEGVCMQIKLVYQRGVYAVSWQSTLVVDSDVKKNDTRMIGDV